MAVRENDIFAECFVDTNIMKTLLRLDGVNHQYGCSSVISGMERGRFADGFAVGIIDDDKKKPSGYEYYTVLACSDHLRLMKHPDKPHYLVFVCKAAEDLLLSCAEELHLDMGIFALPSSLEGLKDATKSNDSDRDPRIKKLVNAVRCSSEMSRLERIISYLRQEKYAAKYDVLRMLFNQ